MPLGFLMVYPMMVYPMMVTLNIQHLKQGLPPKLQGTAQFINFALSTLTATLFFTRNDGIALVYGTVMRNLSIARAIAINAYTAKRGPMRRWLSPLPISLTSVWRCGKII